MKRILFACIALLCLGSCTQQNNPVPNIGTPVATSTATIHFHGNTYETTATGSASGSNSGSSVKLWVGDNQQVFITMDAMKFGEPTGIYTWDSASQAASTIVQAYVLDNASGGMNYQCDSSGVINITTNNGDKLEGTFSVWVIEGSSTSEASGSFTIYK